MLDEFLIFKTLQKGFGTISLKKELEKMGSFQAIFEKEKDYFLKKSHEVKEFIKILEKRSVNFITQNSKLYPETLKNIYDPPIVLYYCGDINVIQNSNLFSIVGTRKASINGLKIARDFSTELSRNGFTIVSGLAIGVDKSAHLGALEAGGKTIAVLASDPSKSSPVANHLLYKQIIDKGSLVISEFPPNYKILPALFASRNRIVAGLSSGTLVVEATEDSGSLITANFAFENNRNLFSIPGDIDKLNYKGSNLIIKIGKAKLVQEVNDILVEYNLTKVKKSRVELDSLSDEERLIVDLLFIEPRSIDDLVGLNKLSFSSVLKTLSILELNDLIVKSEDEKYRMC